MIPDVVRRRAVRLLPGDVTGVHVVRRDLIVWRLDQRQPLYRPRAAAARARSTRPTIPRTRSAGRTTTRTAGAGLPADVTHVGLRRIRRHQRVHEYVRVRVDIEEVVVRIERAAGPVRAADFGGERHRRQRTVDRAHDGWREERTHLVAFGDLDGFGLERWSQVEQVLLADALSIEGRGLRRKWLGGAGSLLRHVRLWDRPLLDRPDRLAGLPIEDEKKGVLRRLRDGLDRAAIEGHIEQDRRARQVPVPDVVVHRLKVPL